jgi:hypothetical protein
VGVLVLKIIGRSPATDSEASDPAVAIGKKASQLLRLDHAGVGILETAVVDPSSFNNFRQDGAIGEQLVEDILSTVDSGDFARFSQLALRPSISHDYLGLPGVLFSDKSFTQLKYSIEKIYRGWSDEKCTASRMSKLIRHEDSWPAIIIQPKIDDVQTVVSRSARTGQRVSSDDLYNVDIKVTELGPAQVELATKAENILSKPVKVQFVSLDGLLQVVGVSEQMMLDKARFAAFQDLLTCGVADELDLILSAVYRRVAHRKMALSEAAIPCLRWRFRLVAACLHKPEAPAKAISDAPRRPDNPSATPL